MSTSKFLKVEFRNIANEPQCSFPHDCALSWQAFGEFHAASMQGPRCYAPALISATSKRFGARHVSYVSGLASESCRRRISCNVASHTGPSNVGWCSRVCSLISFVRPLLQLRLSTIRVNSFVAGLKRVATNSHCNPPFIAACRLQGARHPHMLDFVAAVIHG